QDASLIHERISMEMFTRMGVPAPREVSTRVFINGAYLGLFNLVETPDGSMLRRLFNENNGYLYEYSPGDWAGVPFGGYHFEFLTALAPYLDPKPWLTHVAVETYMADFDCILGDAFGLNNFFLYRFQNKKLSIFIAWDKDNAFDWTQRPVLQNANQNVLMRRL